MKKHYIAMAGSAGCLPDTCDVYRTRAQAIDSLIQTFDLAPKGRIANELRQYGRADRNAHKHDLVVLEVVDCDCATPWIHSDSMLTQEEWEDR